MALPIIGILAAVVVVANQLRGMVELYPPLWNAYQKWALSSWPNVNPTLAELINLRFRKQIAESEYFERVQEAGINQQYAQQLYEAAHSLLSAADYIALWRRGEMAESQCDDRLAELQLSPETIAHAKKSTEFIPSVQDVIRFAVREAYTPEIAAKFGQYEDMPELYLREASKVGLPAENAKQFWAAHWELPSPTQGFEMFQRGIIEHEDLSLLLRSLDIMPFWRDKLIRVAYNPLTRVDVRRMFNMGVLTEEEVYKAYLDIGYSPENAQRLTAFTTMDTTDEVENMPLSALKSAYKKGIISIEEFKVGLKQLNYTDSVIQFWTTLTEFEKRDKEMDELSKELRAQYQAGMITLDEMRKGLEVVDAPANYITIQIASVQKAKSVKIKLPSLADLRDWLKLGMIRDTDFISRAINLGYSKEDTEMYLTEIAKDTDVTKIKYLPQATYARWYKAGLLTETRYRFVLNAMGVRPEDVEIAVLEGKQSAKATEV